MQSSAWGRYAEIIDPDADVEDLRALFSETKDIKTLGDTNEKVSSSC